MTPARRDAWRDLAERLGLEDAAERAGKLRGVLDLDPQTALEPLFRTRLDLGPETPAAFLYAFEHPAGRAGALELCSALLLEVPGRDLGVPFKALGKQHPVLERLTASASGSATVPLEPAFDTAITLYARAEDADALRALLGPAARAVLLRAFSARGLRPALRLGAGQMLLTVHAPHSEPTPTTALEPLATDLLALYGLIAARGSGAEARD